MTAMLRALADAAVVALAAGAERTSTASGTGVDCQAYEGTGLLVLTSSAGGSGATLDVTIEQSDNNSDFDATAVVTFTQVGNAASTQAKTIDLSTCKRYLRATCTIAGTAKFESAVTLTAFKKYAP